MEVILRVSLEVILHHLLRQKQATIRVRDADARRALIVKLKPMYVLPLA